MVLVVACDKSATQSTQHDLLLCGAATTQSDLCSLEHHFDISDICNCDKSISEIKNCVNNLEEVCIFLQFYCALCTVAMLNVDVSYHNALMTKCVRLCYIATSKVYNWHR